VHVRRSAQFVALTVAALLAARAPALAQSAATGRVAGVVTATPVGIAAAKLTAALVPAGGNVRGSIDIDSGVEPNKSRVRIELRGASVGAEHGWQVRTGRCGETTQVVGSPAAYRAITVRGDGTADMTVTIPIVLDGSRQYNVALLANRTDLDGVIACGNLTAR
jgi:hypothetical protein